MSFLNIEWSPKDYDAVSVMADEAGNELFSRLEWMTLKPKVIVDMGCGTGKMSVKLREKYPAAQVISLDYSDVMITFAKQNSPASVCADSAYLPFRNQSVDMIFSNFLLPWHENPEQLLREWRRVLRPEGLIILSALGLDTLQELREKMPILPQLVDMHDVGDLLLNVGFADPVLDVNHYTMAYRSKKKMFNELHMSGMLAAEKNLSDDHLQVTYEIIYAHAWKPQLSQISHTDGSVGVPLTQIKRL